MTLRALFLLCLLGFGCRAATTTGDVEMKRDINTVMESHAAELMAIHGVTGVAIGELEDKTPCVLVLVLEDSDAITASIPKILEGHPVRILVSGEIKPMDGD